MSRESPAVPAMVSSEYLARLRPFLMNVYAQNHRLDPHGPEALTTYCRGEVRFHHLDPWDAGGVDFRGVFAGLQEIGYDGYFTIHQPALAQRSNAICESLCEVGRSLDLPDHIKEVWMVADCPIDCDPRFAIAVRTSAAW